MTGGTVAGVDDEVRRHIERLERRTDILLQENNRLRDHVNDLMRFVRGNGAVPPPPLNGSQIVGW